MSNDRIVIAGARGDLGSRIAKALVAKGVRVCALVRSTAGSDHARSLSAAGLEVASVDENDQNSLTAALRDCSCIVSALNGLGDVILQRQQVLLRAASAAGVRRFISSDFSLDFTATTPGMNRNLDLRRQFMTLAEGNAVQVTSILNGAFMDMLGAEMPMIQPQIRRIMYWGHKDQLLDFTSKDNVAEFTARAALDPDAPRILRICGDAVSAASIAVSMSDITGERYRLLRLGGVTTLATLTKIVRKLIPQSEEVFPPWQGMQYMRDMSSGEGKLRTLDNGRYGALDWTTVRQFLSWRFGHNTGR